MNFLLIDELKEPTKVRVKTRYSSKEAEAVIELVNNKDEFENNNFFDKSLLEKKINKGEIIKVVFNEPQARITPGQSAVFYLKDMVLGGGKII